MTDALMTIQTLLYSVMKLPARFRPSSNHFFLQHTATALLDEAWEPHKSAESMFDMMTDR